MRNFTGLWLAALVACAPLSAQALDFPLYDLRVGVRGGLNVNILPDVGEEDPTPVYPGFFGLGWLIGGAISFDYLDIVGLQLEVLYSVESASGTVEFDRDVGTDNKKEESEFTLEASAIHIPLFVRGQIPTGVARPFVHLGVDFVVSRKNHDMVVDQRGDAPAFFEGCSPGIDCDPFPQRDYGVSGIDSSTLMLIGLGLDIDVRMVTVPIEFRLLLRPNFGNSITDRTDFTGGTPAYRYNNEWQYQVLVLVGANYVIF